MSPGNPFILRSKDQRSKPLSMQAVLAWVFALLWVLASSSYYYYYYYYHHHNVILIIGTIMTVQRGSRGGLAAGNKHVLSWTSTVKLVMANDDDRRWVTLSPTSDRCRRVTQVPDMPPAWRHVAAETGADSHWRCTRLNRQRRNENISKRVRSFLSAHRPNGATDDNLHSPIRDSYV